MTIYKIKRKRILAALVIITYLIVFVSTANASGKITSSNHWTLSPVQHGYYMYASGAKGYTTSTAYHRTTINYYVCQELTSTKRVWGKGKVVANTGYVYNKTSNLFSAFKSKVFYYFK